MMRVNLRRGMAVLCLMLLGSEPSASTTVPVTTTTATTTAAGTTTAVTPAKDSSTSTTATSITIATTTAASPPAVDTSTSAASAISTANDATTPTQPSSTTTLASTSSDAAGQKNSTSAHKVTTSPSSGHSGQQSSKVPASTSVSSTVISTSTQVAGTTATVTEKPATKGQSTDQPPSPSTSSTGSSATGSTVPKSTSAGSNLSSTAAAVASTIPALKPTTAAPTSAPKYPPTPLVKPFQLDFKVGRTNDSAIYCTEGNCTFMEIANDVRAAFSTVRGYLYVREEDSETRRRKRDTQVSVEVLFDPTAVTSLSEEDRRQEIHRALTTMSSSAQLQVDMVKANQTIADQFVKADVCKIPGACTAGYVCQQQQKQPRCHHLCESHSCGDHGVCSAVVKGDGTAAATCVCDSDDDHTYSGDRCQDEEMSKAKVAAILGGVLGTLCAFLLLLTIFLCCRMRGDSDRSSRGKYQLGGHSNNGYVDQEFAMRDRS